MFTFYSQVWFQNRRAKMSRARAAAAAAAAANAIHPPQAPNQTPIPGSPAPPTTINRIPAAHSKDKGTHDLIHPSSAATSTTATAHSLQPIAPMPLQRPIPSQPPPPAPPVNVAANPTSSSSSSLHAGDKRPIAPRRPAQNRHSMAFPLDVYRYPNLAPLDHPTVSPTPSPGIPSGVQHSMANLTLQPRRHDSQAGRARKRPKSAIDILASAAEYVGQDSNEEIKGERTPVR